MASRFQIRRRLRGFGGAMGRVTIRGAKATGHYGGRLLGWGGRRAKVAYHQARARTRLYARKKYRRLRKDFKAVSSCYAEVRKLRRERKLNKLRDRAFIGPRR